MRRPLVEHFGTRLPVLVMGTAGQREHADAEGGDEETSLTGPLGLGKANGDRSPEAPRARRERNEVEHGAGV
jgi:hypothetical protein